MVLKNYELDTWLKNVQKISTWEDDQSYWSLRKYTFNFNWYLHVFFPPTFQSL